MIGIMRQGHFHPEMEIDVMKISQKTVPFFALALCAMALPASAVPIFQPDTANTDQAEFNPTNPDAINGVLGVNNLIQQRNGVGDVVTDSTDTVTGTPSSGGNQDYAYASALTTTTYPGTLTFGFDSAVSVDTFYLWNFSHPTLTGPRLRGIQNFELRFYDDIDGSSGTGALITTVAGLTAAIGPAPGVDISSQAFDLGGIQSGVRSVELIVASNHNGNPGAGGNNFFAAREIAFSVVPEPTSAALLLGGVFGLLGVVRRRR